ncbi:MAG TPA: hypothetical protein VH500_19980 [Nitrososphaeraceae archaeon]
MKEFESWKVHDDEDPSSLALSSEHLLATTTSNGEAMETNKMLDNNRRDEAMARCRIWAFSELL